MTARLIFLHIPKTAGSTLRKIIGEQYRENEILKCYYHKQGLSLEKALDDVKALPEERANQIKIILGHLGFGVHERLPWPCSYMTILRDPVDRVVSGYYHILRDDCHQYQGLVRNMTLKEYVSSNQLRSEAARINAVNALDNFQTRLLSGAVVRAELSRVTADYGECSIEMLQLAKANLRNHFVAVGISERFDESLKLFGKVLGWPSIYYVKANVGWNRNRKEEISSDTLRCIEKYNELDIELYRYARQMFEEAIDRQGLLFKRRVDSYRVINKAYGHARRVMWAIEKRLTEKTPGLQR
jgi:hypothetical protein